MYDLREFGDVLVDPSVTECLDEVDDDTLQGVVDVAQLVRASNTVHAVYLVNCVIRLWITLNLAVFVMLIDL